MIQAVETYSTALFFPFIYDNFPRVYRIERAVDY